MALAARCPHCGASFRVVSDQLKLKGGLVRCGECRQVFDALAHLNAIEGPAPPATAAPPPPTPAAPPPPALPPPLAPSPSPSPSSTLAESAAAEIEVVAAPAPESAAPPTAAAAAAPSGVAGKLSRRSNAHAPGADTDTDTEPAFLRRRPHSRWARAGWSLASLLLVGLLIVQVALALRADLVGRWPALRPALAELCRHAHCDLRWPRRPEALTLLGTELEALPGTDAFEFGGTLRNRAEHVVAAPAIELTLAEADGRIVARRIWRPEQLYGEAERGIEAGGELVFRIGFAAPGVKPASFVAYPLYTD